MITARSIDRIRERRRLVEADQRAARLAELHHIAALLADAAVTVRRGWVQSTWYVVDRQRGALEGACLVGAIVHAGGGPAAAHSQLVQRTLDLTWHTLFQGQDRPMPWCPAPSVRQACVRDLTRWNDQPGRTVAQVLALLDATRAAARAESLRLQPRVPVRQHAA
jgi:hypothetical protein